MSPKFSVVMPCYNVAPFVAEAIHSVLRQSFRDFELIMVDDGSTDQTAAICSRFLGHNVHLVSQENRGLAAARNSGIRAAKGEYIALLDSDDLWHPRKLEHHLALLEANPELGISFDPSTFMDDRGALLGIVQTPRLIGIEASHVFTRNPIGCGSAPVIRRAALDEIQTENVNGACWFDESFRQSEDIEMWVRLSLTTSWQIAGLEQSLTFYRVSDHGLSANVSKQLESWEKMVAKTALYAPGFIAQWGELARAYQLRYLARRAVRSRDGHLALRLLGRSLSANWSISLREPKRTLATLGAASLLSLLPRRLYEFVERCAMGVASLHRGATS
ncbi:glycosyltransferase family 2 protein [Magnetospirillum sp. SS-4]|uniref:glycosyltransferase family 2 protein n=1 Tax=Magnetospirillum sp. SS-4 TaxID=2681465 RepID=UPI001382B61D|nr:glycosyltransferase family 2 protein [Magnetospirillum sp. SS-4]CAA7621943.1 Glycosyl transferase family 2 [Magnetospirillum sp. SS-4]